MKTALYIEKVARVPWIPPKALLETKKKATPLKF